MMDHIRVAGAGLAAEVGWYVERDGRRLALLTDAPGFLSCRLQPLTSDPADLAVVTPVGPCPASR
jgi:hypothetical protein